MSFWDWVKDNVVTIAGTAAMAVVTGGSSLVVQAVCIGGAVIVGSAIDSDRKKKENESKQIEANKQITGEIKDAVNNLQNDRSQLASQANTIDQQIAQKQNKLNDPNTSETEKAQIRSEIAALVSNRSSLEQKIKDLDKQVADLIKSNPNSKQEPGLINLPKAQDLDFQTKLMIGAVIFLIIYFMMIKDQDRR